MAGVAKKNGRIPPPIMAMNIALKGPIVLTSPEVSLTNSSGSSLPKFSSPYFIFEC
jgi:hypothetical protein